MSENTFHIYKSKIFLSILLLILVEPAYFRKIDSIHMFFSLGRFAVLALLILLLIRRKHVSNDQIWVAVFYGTIFVSTIINSGSVKDYIGSICSSLAMCLIFVLWIEKNPDTLFDAFKALELYVYINFITIVMFPTGMYNSGLFNESWFLGFKNPQIRTILPVVCISLIRSYRNKGRITIATLLLLACSAVTMVLNGSSTGLVGIVIFISLLFLFHKKYKKLPKLFSLLGVTIGTASLFIGIFVFQIQEAFAYLIVGILGKDLNFTNRSGIWTTSAELIKEKIIFGYGYLSEQSYVSMFNYRAATHPHNYFLYLLMSGGIVLLIVWGFGVLRANSKLNSSMQCVYSKIILFTLCSFLIMGLTESLVSTELLYPMFILGMKADFISELPYQDKKFTIFGKRITIGNTRKAG